MWVIKDDYWETDPRMLTVREGSPCLVTKFLASFPKKFSIGQQVTTLGLLKPVSCASAILLLPYLLFLLQFMGMILKCYVLVQDLPLPLLLKYFLVLFLLGFLYVD